MLLVLVHFWKDVMILTCIWVDSGWIPTEPGKKGLAGKFGQFWNTGMRYSTTLLVILVH